MYALPRFFQYLTEGQKEEAHKQKDESADTLEKFIANQKILLDLLEWFVYGQSIYTFRFTKVADIRETSIIVTAKLPTTDINGLDVLLSGYKTNVDILF